MLLEEYCFLYVLRKFEFASKNEDFFKIDFRSICNIFNSDDLVTTDETKVFKRVVQFIDRRYSESKKTHSFNQTRAQKISKLIHCVRFPLIPEDFIRSSVITHPLYKECDLLQKLVEFALQVHENIKLNDPAKPRVLLEYQCPTKIIKDPINLYLFDENKVSTDQIFKDQLRRRRVKGAKELIHTHDGDENGVFFYIGTNFGKS